MAKDWAQILADANYWGRYRHPDPDNYVDLTLEQVRDNAEADYEEPLPQDLPGAPPVLPALGNEGKGYPLIRPALHVTNPAHLQFLAQQIPSLGIDWEGTKWLGEGGNAQVGLWEHFLPAHPDAPQSPTNLQIAVKEAKTIGGARALEVEAGVYQEFNGEGSQHIVEMLMAPETVTNADLANAGLPPAWKDRVRRLFLEYSPLDTLHDLINRRQRLALPLTELTLWRFFDCLIDGICALEYGSELALRRDGRSDEFIIQKFQLGEGEDEEEYTAKVHFDLKPENILLVREEDIHPVHPILKILDFGLAQEIKPREDGDEAYRRRFRKFGTEDYFAPEQFTERWDYVDWDDTNIAGIYGEWTNVWGIGCIMFVTISRPAPFFFAVEHAPSRTALTKSHHILFCRSKETNADSQSNRYKLVLLTGDCPNQSDPFVPAYNLDGNLPRGITYGTNLSVAHYSKELRDLVQECLYEDINHRPSIQVLKKKARLGIKACIRAGAVPEPWEDLLPAEPVPQHIANPHWPRLPNHPTQAEIDEHEAATKVFGKLLKDERAQDEAKQLQPKNKREKLQELQKLSKERCQRLDKDDKNQCKNRFWTDRTIMYCHRHRG